MSEKRIKVGITHGDINGIGYETILKALGDPRMPEIATLIVYGSPEIAAYYREAATIVSEKDTATEVTIEDAEEATEEAVNYIRVVEESLRPEPGKATRASAEAALVALERGVSDLREGKIDALVTGPFSKATVQSEAFPYPGHTEYLEATLGDAEDHRDKALMVMVAPNGLRVALVTKHLALSKVPEAITEEAVAQTVRDFNRSLREDFAVSTPRIAVLSLNPHAGENGLLGEEEEKVIIPAIGKVNEEGILAFGPYAADGFFGAGNWRKFDGVVAMYHDQGLTPFKVMALDDGVNYTAGLPWVRTSPDHGTAFDIAGKGEADGGSMRSAIYTAIDIVRNRRRHIEATANPLKKQMRNERTERPERFPKQPKENYRENKPNEQEQ